MVAVCLLIDLDKILPFILTSGAVALTHVAKLKVIEIIAPLPGYRLEDGPPVTEANRMISLKGSLVCKKVPLNIALAVTGFHLI